MSNDVLHLSNYELDTIGEVMNISMGSGATALSTMLDRKVDITTPQVKQAVLRSIDCSVLEPAIMVKIKYVEGIEGTNLIVLSRRDMQVILNLLMGNEADPSDDFEFDEMSMSAACEVMNQMMGASATALSEVLGTSTNISTPEGMLVDKFEDSYPALDEINPDDDVVAISFELDIDSVLNTTFTSFLPIPMSKKIVEQASKDLNTESSSTAAAAQPAPAAASAAAPTQQPAAQPSMPEQPAMAPMQNAAADMMPQQMPPMPQMMPQMPQQMPQMPQQQMPQMQQQMQQMPQQGMYGQMPWNGGYPNGMYPGYPMPMQPGMGMPGQMPQQEAAQSVNVKKAEFPAFSTAVGMGTPLADSNLNLLMNIPLEVSVVIGKTKRKIKDIINWGQGAVVELDKQTGAPAEIIVNGKLLAYGDVVVIDDNFGIRVTEIVGAEELIESLTGKEH